MMFGENLKAYWREVSTPINSGIVRRFIGEHEHKVITIDLTPVEVKAMRHADEWYARILRADAALTRKAPKRFFRPGRTRVRLPLRKPPSVWVLP